VFLGEKSTERRFDRKVDVYVETSTLRIEIYVEKTKEFQLNFTIMLD
jgi:hypothetical protein